MAKATKTAPKCDPTFVLADLTQVQVEKLMDVLNAINDDDLDAVYWALSASGAKGGNYELQTNKGSLVSGAKVVAL